MTRFPFAKLTAHLPQDRRNTIAAKLRTLQFDGSTPPGLLREVNAQVAYHDSRLAK